ncbi:MAG: pyridoxamine 5'-phosphate oxidase family protein [Thermomicrobiales bacterium]
MFERTKRNKVLRKPARATAGKDEVYRIVDKALYCHVAFASRTASRSSSRQHLCRGSDPAAPRLVGQRMIRHGDCNPLCVTMTLIDGIVLARSAFNHSVNYRSAILFGNGEAVTNPEAKMDALERFTERLMPGRWDDIRWPDRKELKATGVIAMPIESASAKVRTGPPVDDEPDMQLPTWAGVLPLRQLFGAPVADPNAPVDVALPGYLEKYLEARLPS